MEDAVTLALGGAVPLRQFAQALDGLTKVLQQLASDAGARIEWIIAGLDCSSAVATVAGRPLDEASEPLVPGVVEAFGEAGEAVAYGRPSTASARTLHLLREIAGLVDKGVDEVSFETAEREAVVRPGAGTSDLNKPMPSRDRGSVVGRVQTLQARGQLRFTLYDLAHDRAVSCWLSTGQEDLMRDAWGHLVEVEGLVSRDPVTNVPLGIRQVSGVRLFPEAQTDAWLAARGAVRAPDAPPAEEVLRSARDAWQVRRLYFDANVFLAFVSDEPSRAAVVEELLRLAQARSLVVMTSTVSMAEVAFGAEEKSRQSLDEEVEARIDALWAPGGPVTLIEASRHVLTAARGLVRANLAGGHGGSRRLINPPGNRQS